MKTLKLHEIIDLSDDSCNGILIELIVPYKKQLLTYYRNMYNSEPVLIVTSVFNACSYGFICPSDEFHEAICTYLDDYSCDEETSENLSTYETICFNSIMLSNL